MTWDPDIPDEFDVVDFVDTDRAGPVTEHEPHPHVERTGTCDGCGATVEWIPLSMGGWGAPEHPPRIGSHAWTVDCPAGGRHRVTSRLT